MAALRCLTVPSDATDVAAVRGQIDVTCPCATYDHSSSATGRGAFLACARGVVGDASDGSPIGGTISLRPECRGTMNHILRDSDCGTAPALGLDPCCQHRVADGRNRGSMRAAGKCTSTPSQIRNDCPFSHYVADACSNDATNSCNPVCGDGVKNGTEQCDGSDATACPGICNANCTCPGIALTAISVPSAAMPAQTPGSPGVTPTNPKLLTQFGGSSFSLNNASAVRIHYDTNVTPGAILILVPGFEGGANDFKIMGENLLPRVLNDGLLIEVWAFDRRTNQLEDLEGLQIAEALADPFVALDWYFGSELSLPLSPALVSGPNRRAVFYNTSSDVPFMANWTNLMFSQDIDAMVGAADAAVANHNVFLGGHSAGTGFTARYLSTDFNLTGVGPANPGYAKLRGAVLLEGPGGSTAGAPLTADSLDRIIAKFDGGNFGATRDNAGRCVDGTTACTLADEATTCVGQVPPKCTPAAAAYSVVAGLLNPRILGAGEVTGIQTILDPDTGEGLLGVDQGSPGNNAIQKVPDLGPLVFLPKGTAQAGLGSFIDDDGAISGIAPFVATSCGGPGSIVAGSCVGSVCVAGRVGATCSTDANCDLLTWQDIDEGVLPPVLLPYNGPQPTTLPGGKWGQEKEVTRMARMTTSFYAGPSNFTDMYYPAAGPATTSAPGRCVSSSCVAGNVGAPCGSDAACAQSINLDSSALSIGRGRRDIENLTQAANVNIPVICFGGSNGLAPVPGAYTAFASSIGACTAPSCTGGTPRVVNASTPNPAFPTFGDVAGGFEVYISEGFAHLDIVTAEDNADNNVLAPLAAFLERNVQ
jgi:pimeloyl-ACP methyl ester carboxylesterase